MAEVSGRLGRTISKANYAYLYRYHMRGVHAKGHSWLSDLCPFIDMRQLKCMIRISMRTWMTASSVSLSVS